MSSTPLDELLDKLNSGDVAAAEQVFVTYEPYLRMVVRRMLPDSMRRRFDSIDVVHSVWADLLTGFRDADWRFKDVAHLRGFLVKATRNRFVDRYRKSQRAGAAELENVKESLAHPSGDAEARPSQVVQANELWTQMLELCAEQHRPLLNLRRQGCTLAEIAQKTGYHPSSVRRIFYDLARQLAFANQEPK